jgi:hypothetical protein
MFTFVNRLLALTAVVFSCSLYAAPKADLWEYWQPFADAKTVEIDHQSYQEFLDSYLVVQGQHTLVKYNQVTSKDKLSLKTYLSKMSEVDPHQLTRGQQYAFWVNLYNAYTIDIILDNYPTKSITKIGGLFSFGPWDKEITTINGQALTLNDIEHRILRPIWQDPRTHYAVNCASLGCPNLQQYAFTDANTEQLLQQAMQSYISSDKGVLLSNGQLTLSSIYDWFEVDFGGSDGVVEHLAEIRPELADYSGKVKFDYDWSLNEVK